MASSSLRLVWRLPQVVAWTAGVCGVLAVGKPLCRLFGRSSRALRSWGFRRWCGALTGALGTVVEVEGTPPKAPFLLVSNHLGYFDILVLGGLVSGARCVARADVRQWPVVGSMCRLGDTIFVNRETRQDVVRVNREIERAVASGDGILLFPEGTSSSGEGVLPFRSSLLESAASGSFPVHYASITYGDLTSSESPREVVCWWGEMPFLGHCMKLLSLRQIRARVVFGDDVVVGKDRKRLATQTRARVVANFLPVPGAEEVS